MEKKKEGKRPSKEEKALKNEAAIFNQAEKDRVKASIIH